MFYNKYLLTFLFFLFIIVSIPNSEAYEVEVLAGKAQAIHPTYTRPANTDLYGVTVRDDTYGLSLDLMQIGRDTKYIGVSLDFNPAGGLHLSAGTGYLSTNGYYDSEGKQYLARSHQFRLNIAYEFEFGIKVGLNHFSNCRSLCSRGGPKSKYAPNFGLDHLTIGYVFKF